VTGLLAGCAAPITPVAPESLEAAPAATAPLDSAVAAYRLTELAFEGNGNTFLAAIEDAASGEGLHRYLELRDTEGNLWQGELLGSAEGSSLFLQQAQGGGSTAVRIEGPAEFDPTSAAELLPEMGAEPLASPHPEIRFVRATQGDETWRFDVTLAYPDTGWQDYADGWHVATPDGVILGTRVLLHPHENEQPFTRSLSGVTIPAGVTEILIRSHDLLSGYSPDTLAIPLTEDAATDRYEVTRNGR
jgi:hypothetical protein